MDKRFTSSEKGKGRVPSPQTNGYQTYSPRPALPENQKSNSAKEVNGRNGQAEQPKAKANSATHAAINPAATDNLSQVDKAFAQRVEANNLKPVLGRDIKGLYPIWSHTRRGLQSALEYMRNPIKTTGGSVDISPGGLARGIILEGAPASDLAFWGQGVEGGTFLLPM